jgi:hypothetical protein
MGFISALLGGGDSAGASDRDMRAAAATNVTAARFDSNLLNQVDGARREARRLGTPEARERHEQAVEAQRRWNSINFR